MKFLKLLFEKTRGYKSYLVGLAAVVYGLYAGDTDAVLLGLGLFGLRHAVSGEVSKVLFEVSKRKK